MDNRNISELTLTERDNEERASAELVLEVIEACIKEGLWDQDKGLVGLEDTLEETWIHPQGDLPLA